MKTHAVRDGRSLRRYARVREITLSLSCPAVAKILMNRREPVAYLSYEKEGEESYGDFDLLLYSVLADAREVVLDLLKNRALPVEKREEQMLMARWMKNEKMLDSEDVIETVYRYSREIEHSDKNLERMERIMEILPANLTSYVSGFVPPYTV